MSTTHKEQGILSIAMILGWEEVERAQVEIVLGGFLPLRALLGIMDLII